MGEGIDEAVQHAHLKMKGRYHPSPLLCVFTDGSKLTPLIAAGQRLRPRTARTTTYKMLAESQIRVLENGFVGRRREIQTGMRVLKGFSAVAQKSPCERKRVIMGKASSLTPDQRGPAVGQEVPMRTPKR
jgi:hypothetical protein